MRSSAATLSYFGRIIHKCKTLLSELKDNNVLVKFVKRSANMVAHFLAKFTTSVADLIWRVNDNHQEFIDVLMNNLIHAKKIKKVIDFKKWKLITCEQLVCYDN